MAKQYVGLVDMGVGNAYCFKSRWDQRYAMGIFLCFFSATLPSRVVLAVCRIWD